MYSRILVPIDGSDCANAALLDVPRVVSEAQPVIQLIHVVEWVDAHEQFQPGTVGAIIEDTMRADAQAILDAGRDVLSARRITCEIVLAESHRQKTSAVIVQHATALGADLIVMGTHGRRGIRQVLLGSDAAEVVSSAQIPVLLVREKYPRTPIGGSPRRSQPI